MTMTLIGLVSLACLLVTGGLASLAVFSHHFDDSLLQRVGLSIVAISCFVRVPIKLAHPDTPPELLAAQLGLAAYAFGTAIKLYRLSRSGSHERRGRRGHAHHRTT